MRGGSGVDGRRAALGGATGGNAGGTGAAGAAFGDGRSPATATSSEARPASAMSATPSEALGTRIYVNLSMPDQAERVAALPVDGVGLLRAEFMITEALGGKHPRALIAEGGRQVFVDAMAGALSRITRAFAPRPVVYRTYDFRTNEFRGLTGGDAFEPHEENPDDRLSRMLPVRP